MKIKVLREKETVRQRQRDELMSGGGGKSILFNQHQFWIVSVYEHPNQ